MSIEICPLFSGSDGNSIYIGDKSGAFLVDAGRNTKQLEAALYHNNLKTELICSVFVTHEHTDHISAIRVFSKKYKIKIYSSAGTIGELKSKGILDNVEYEAVGFDGVTVNGTFVKPFPISHDCIEGYGYTVEANGTKVAVCSDLGVVTDEVVRALEGSDIVFIESNHDIEMLKNGSYPHYLKKRILSEKGHLSNLACGELITNLARSGTRKFVLLHLSKENNTEEIAYTSAHDALCRIDAENFMLAVAPRVNHGEIKIIV
jgi:phosphoribosyl 1,2-cyclic phosphodiesterase